MREFHGSNGNGFGDIWWTDKFFYFSNCIDFACFARLEFSCAYTNAELVRVKDIPGHLSVASVHLV